MVGSVTLGSILGKSWHMLEEATHTSWWPGSKNKGREMDKLREPLNVILL